MGKEKQNLVGKYPTITSFAIILFCNSDQKRREKKEKEKQRDVKKESKKVKENLFEMVCTKIRG